MWPYLGPGSRYCPDDPRYATLHRARCIMKAHQRTRMTPWGYGVGYERFPFLERTPVNADATEPLVKDGRALVWWSHDISS